MELPPEDGRKEQGEELEVDFTVASMELPPEDGRKVRGLPYFLRDYRLQWSYRPKTVERLFSFKKK